METHATRTPIGSVVRHGLRQLGRLVRDALARRRAARRRVRAWHDMRRLSDATLRDIGLQRSDLTLMLMTADTVAPPRHRSRRSAWRAWCVGWLAADTRAITRTGA